MEQNKANPSKLERFIKPLFTPAMRISMIAEERDLSLTVIYHRRFLIPAHYKNEL
jgi:hypothetical protein